MADVTISPNMLLPIPVPGVDPGPDWANNIVADMYAIDSHDHTSGKGVQITPDGMNINADLEMNSNDLTEARSVRFTPQVALISDPADIGCLYESGVDLYYNDGAGNVVRITQAGVVTGATGTITGLPSGTASASFAGGTFTFQSATNTPATMAVGPLVIGSASVSPKTVTLAPSASQAANYSLTFPLVAPEANQVPISDGSGNLSWTRGLLPLGAVIGTFPNLAGAYVTSATTTADANGYVQCNGQTLADVTSPMNGAVIPNINNTVFLAGNTTSGTAGGAAEVVLSTANLLPHNHDGGSLTTSVGVTGGTASLTGTTTFGAFNHAHNISHYHKWGHQEASNSRIYTLNSGSSATTGITSGSFAWLTYATSGVATGVIAPLQPLTFIDQELFTTGVLDPQQGTPGSGAFSGDPSITATVGISSTAASMTGSNAVTGNTGNTGTGTAFSILPTYITSRYLMRVK